ncbi:MAG: hypothetical protein WBM75_17590 [Polyangiales bacterium]
MKTIHRAMLRKCTVPILVFALGLLTGCLYAGDPGHIEFDASKAVSMAGVRMAALIDSKMSTLDIFQDDLSYDQDSLQVSLAGHAFTSGSLLRIQLYLAQASNPADADTSDKK